MYITERAVPARTHAAPYAASIHPLPVKNAVDGQKRPNHGPITDLHSFLHDPIRSIGRRVSDGCPCASRQLLHPALPRRPPSHHQPTRATVPAAAQLAPWSRAAPHARNAAEQGGGRRAHRNASASSFSCTPLGCSRSVSVTSKITPSSCSIIPHHLSPSLLSRTPTVASVKGRTLTAHHRVDRPLCWVITEQENAPWAPHRDVS